MRRWHDEAQARKYREAGIWGDKTMPEMFDEHVAAHPGKLAVIDGEVRWTYGELADLTLRAAQLLLNLGVRPGDPVAAQVGVVTHCLDEVPSFTNRAHYTGQTPPDPIAKSLD